MTILINTERILLLYGNFYMQQKSVESVKFKIFSVASITTFIRTVRKLPQFCKGVHKQYQIMFKST